MFDLFAPSTSEINRRFREQTENWLALAMLLGEKGIITDEEFASAKIRAISMLDQLIAEEKQKAYDAMDEKDKKMVDFMGKIFGVDSAELP